MSVMASQITSVSTVCWTICIGIDQRRHQSSVSLALVRGTTVTRVEGPVMWNMIPFDDIIMRFMLLLYFAVVYTLLSVVLVWKQWHLFISTMIISLAQWQLYNPVKQSWIIWVKRSHKSNRYPWFTHLPWTKWPPFRRWYFQMHFREWKLCILIKISLNLVRKGPIDNNPTLV